MTGPFNQFLVPVGDIEKLANAMQSALENYPEIDQLDMDRFASDNVAERYLALITNDS